MKKQMILFFCGMLVALGITACGTTEEQKETTKEVVREVEQENVKDVEQADTNVTKVEESSVEESQVEINKVESMVKAPEYWTSVKEAYYKADGTESYCNEYVYDTLGNLRWEKKYDIEEDIYCISFSGYDVNNKLNYNVQKEGFSYVREEYQYNDKGDIILFQKLDGYGNVIEKKEYSYLDDSMIEREYKKSVILYERKYDLFGKLVDEISYEADKMNYWYSYTYNENDMLIRIINNVEESDEKKVVYRAAYDANNNLLVNSFKGVSIDTREGYWKYIYDTDNRLIKKYKFYGLDNFELLQTNTLPEELVDNYSECYFYIYDEAGHLLVESKTKTGDIRLNVLATHLRCDRFDLAIAKKINSYDESGRIVQELQGEFYYDVRNNECIYLEEFSNIDKFLKYKYEADEDGNFVTTFLLEKEGMDIPQEKTTYDKNGNKLKHEKYLESGAVSEWTDYIYDAEGNLQEVCTYSAMGTLQERIAYEYTKIEAGVTVDDIIHNPNLDVSTELKRGEIISRLTDMIMSEYEKSLVFDWLSEIEMTPDEIAIYSQQLNSWDSDL